MSERDDYPAGVPCSVTNLSSDVQATLGYYSELFGWEGEYNDEGDFAIATLRGREVAGLGHLPPPPGDQPAWVTNVRVDSAAETADRVAAAGGTVLAKAMDMAPAGVLTVLADPTGAVICAWEALTRKGAQIINEPGAWAMSALQTPDPDAAAAFYGTVFGWETEPFGDLTMFRLPGFVGGEPQQPVPRDVVAMMLPAADGPAAWHVDFWIAAAEHAVATTERWGGTVLGGVEDAGPFRRATLTDPAGAPFTASQLVPERLGVG